MMASDSANSASTSNSEHAWFVDSGASHHMTSHQEWFRDLRRPDRPGYIGSRVEAGTGEDAGSKYVREREYFCLTTDARCNGGKPSERERAIRVLSTRKMTQRSK